MGGIIGRLKGQSMCEEEVAALLKRHGVKFDKDNL
jgi:hypothetical protein